MSWSFYDSGGNLQLAQVPAVQVGVLEVIIDGGINPPATGIAVDLPVNFSGVLLAWEVVSRTSGSIVLDIWRKSSWPPLVADTIIDVVGGGVKPALSSATQAVSSSLAHWSTAFAAGDTFTINVDSASTLTKVTLALKYQRS